MTNTNRGHISKLENGKVGISDQWIRKLCASLKCTPSDLFLEQKRIPLVGFVSDNGRIFTLKELSGELPKSEKIFAINPDKNQFEVSPIIGEDSDKYEAVVVKGNVNVGLKDGWVIYYDKKHEKISNDHIDKLCIVKVKGGDKLIRWIHNGYTKGKYNLESYGGQISVDQNVDWVSKIENILLY